MGWATSNGFCDVLIKKIILANGNRVNLTPVHSYNLSLNAPWCFFLEFFFVVTLLRLHLGQRMACSWIRMMMIPPSPPKCYWVSDVVSLRPYRYNVRHDGVGLNSKLYKVDKQSDETFSIVGSFADGQTDPLGSKKEREKVHESKTLYWFEVKTDILDSGDNKNS